jgi:hypothetical protein
VVAGLLKILRIASLSSALRKRAMRQGLLEGRSGWQTLALVFLGISVMKRLSGPKVQILASEKLRPGQSVTVSAVPQRSSRGPSAKHARP